MRRLVWAALLVCAEGKRSQSSDCDDPNLKSLCTAAGQVCTDLDKKRNGAAWGCICRAGADNTFAPAAPSDMCDAAPDTPAPPTQAPPTPSPPTPAPPTPAPTTEVPRGPFGCDIIEFCEEYVLRKDSDLCDCRVCAASYVPVGDVCVEETPLPPTPAPPTPQPTPAPPKGFSGLCPEVALPGGRTFQATMQLGIAGDRDEPAVRFVAKFALGTWGALGLRAAESGRMAQMMRGLDITGFDAAALDDVVDCEVMHADAGPPTRSLPSQSLMTLDAGSISRGQPVVGMWRLLRNGHDIPLDDGMELDIARAMGAGHFGGSHSAHEVSRVTIAACDALRPYLPTPAPPPPEAWDCTFIHNCDLYMPGGPGAASTDCLCGRCDDGYTPIGGGRGCAPPGSTPTPTSSAPTPAPELRGPFGCNYIHNCDFYDGAAPACTCGRCKPGAVVSFDRMQCVGEVAPFTCTLIEGCALYRPSTTRDAQDCTCGQCRSGLVMDASALACDAVTDVPGPGGNTGAPTTGQPTTGEPTTGEPTTGEPRVVLSTGRPTTGEPTTGEPTTGAPSTAAPLTDAPGRGSAGRPTTAAPSEAAARPDGEPAEGPLLPVVAWLGISGTLVLSCATIALLYLRVKRSRKPKTTSLSTVGTLDFEAMPNHSQNPLQSSVNDFPKSPRSPKSVAALENSCSFGVFDDESMIFGGAEARQSHQRLSIQYTQSQLLAGRRRTSAAASARNLKGLVSSPSSPTQDATPEKVLTSPGSSPLLRPKRERSSARKGRADPPRILTMGGYGNEGAVQEGDEVHI